MGAQIENGDNGSYYGLSSTCKDRRGQLEQLINLCFCHNIVSRRHWGRVARHPCANGEFSVTSERGSSYGHNEQRSNGGQKILFPTDSGREADATSVSEAEIGVIDHLECIG